MAAKNESESVASCSSSGSGYVIVTAKPVNVSSLNSVEKLEQKLSETQEINKQLEEKIQNYKRQILDNKRTIDTMRASVKAAKDPKTFDIRQARLANSKLRRENETLLRTIEEHETTIRILKQNKNDIKVKLDRMQKGQSKKPPKQLKVDDSDANEREIQYLKQKLQDQALEIEENEKYIANLSKLYEKALTDMTEIKDMLLKKEEREAERDRKLDEILKAVKNTTINTSGTQNENDSEKKKDANVRPIVKQEGDKAIWHY